MWGLGILWMPWGVEIYIKELLRFVRNKKWNVGDGRGFGATNQVFKLVTYLFNKSYIYEIDGKVL